MGRTSGVERRGELIALGMAARRYPSLDHMHPSLTSPRWTSTVRKSATKPEGAYASSSSSTAGNFHALPCLSWRLDAACCTRWREIKAYNALCSNGLQALKPHCTRVLVLSGPSFRIRPNQLDLPATGEVARILSIYLDTILHTNSPRMVGEKLRIIT